MSDTSSSSSSGGIGFVGLLTIVFIILKLIPYKDHHIIDWSWWWVLSPLWISTLIVLLIILITILFAVFVSKD